MNILTDELPESVEIGGREYAINTDFRTCLRIILAFEDRELTKHEKQVVALANLYPELPDDTEEAIKQAGWFMNGGQDSKEETGYRLYSFSKDASLIYAAFRQTHGIDLQSDPLHWWKFIALFMDLGQDTTFCQLVGLRKRYKTGKVTKEERHAIMEMGDIFNVPEPDTRTIEQMEADRLFDEAVAELTRKRDGR